MKLLLVLTVVLLLAVFVWSAFARKEKEIVTAILGGATVIGAAIVGATLTHYQAKEREIEDAHRLKKIEVYTEFIDLVVSGFSAVKRDANNLSPEEITIRQENLQKEIAEGFLTFSKKLLLWGSPEVITTYEKFRTFGQDPANNANPRILIYADEVFQAMRADLGLTNRGLSEGDLMKLFLSDPKELDRLLR